MSTLELRIFANQIPILLETTDGITHGMGILTLDEWTGIICLDIFLTIPVVHIHRTEDICLASMTSLLILHRTHLIECLDPVVCFLEVRSIASLITKTPDNDRGMITEGDDISLIALQMGLLIILTLGKCTLTITHAMTLHISLSRQVDTILVTEVIPTGIVRIVTGAYSVDIQLLHNFQVLDHP